MAKGGNVMQESVNKVVESEETAGHIEVPVTAELKADEPEDKEPEAEDTHEDESEGDGIFELPDDYEELSLIPNEDEPAQLVVLHTALGSRYTRGDVVFEDELAEADRLVRTGAVAVIDSPEATRALTDRAISDAAVERAKQRG